MTHGVASRSRSQLLYPHDLQNDCVNAEFPLEEGAVVVATHDPHGGVMLEVIRELGLEIHVIFNRGAVMALPPGINKATGLDGAQTRNVPTRSRRNWRR